jgi:hypothetical protein
MDGHSLALQNWRNLNRKDAKNAKKLKHGGNGKTRRNF